LAGEQPFERTGGDDVIGAILVGRMTPLSSLRPDLPPALTSVVHRAMARLPTERIASAQALAAAFRSAVEDMGRDPFSIDETRRAAARAPISNEEALGPTLMATPVRVETRAHREPPPTRTVARRTRRGWLWLLLPLIAILCAVPTLGTATVVGCQSYLTDMQIRLSTQKLRGAIDEHQLPELHAELEQLERLHRSDRVGFFAAAAFNARVQRAIERDDRLDREELLWVMELVRDI